MTAIVHELANWTNNKRSFIVLQLQATQPDALQPLIANTFPSKLLPTPSKN